MVGTNEEAGAQAAAAFREKYDLGNAPVSDLNDLIEGRLGIDVAVLHMDEGLDGMVIQDPATGQRIISAACTTSSERQRATLAHEVGHLALGDFAEGGVIRCGTRSPEEIRADTFARHLLAPTQGVNEFFEGIGRERQQLTEADLSHAVRYFEVPPMMLLIQLSAAGWLAADQKEAWSALSVGKLAARHGWSDEHRASQRKAMTPQAPMRIVAKAMEAYENNLIGLEAVADIRGMDPRDLADELTEVDIRPGAVVLPPSRFRPMQVTTDDLDSLTDHSGLIVLDAGPILNFLGRDDTTDLYLKTLKEMANEIIVPDAAVDEVERKSNKDRRFAGSRLKLLAVIYGRDITTRISPARQENDEYEFQWAWVRNNCPKTMLASGKNRGSMVLIAHALVLRGRGFDVVAMIDDQDATELAAKAGISSFTTVELFQEGVARGLIADKVQLKRLYGFVAKKDDDLRPFRETELTKEFSGF